MAEGTDDSVLERNLAALKQKQPMAEKLLRDTPSASRPGRDSSFLRDIPSDVNGIAIEGMQPPGMLRAFVQEFGAERVFFVMERDCAAALDTLSQCDLSEYIAGDRIHFFFGPTAGRQLEDFLLVHDALPVPGWIIPADPEGANFYKGALNLTFARVLQRRQYAIQYMAEESNEYYAGLFPKRVDEIVGGAPVKILMYEVSGGEEARFRRELADAFSALGQQATLFSLRPPFEASLFPVLRRITAVKPDLFLGFSMSRPSIGIWLPPRMPAAFHVHTPLEGLLNEGEPAEERLPRTDIVLATAHRLLAGLAVSGLERRQLFHVPPGIDAARFPSVGEAGARDRSELVFLGDGSTPSPARLGLKAEPALLWSHVAQIIQTEASQYAVGQACLFVRKACERIGLSIGDAETEGRFSLLIECRLARDAQRIGVLERLAERFPVRLHGAGWESIPALRGFAADGVESVEEVAEAYSRAAAAVCLGATGEVTRQMLEAACCGTPILANRSAVDAQVADGGFVEDAEVLAFDSMDGLIEQAGRLTADPDLRQRLSEAALKKVKERYDIRRTAEGILQSWRLALEQGRGQS